MFVILFPTKAEALIFLRRLSKVSRSTFRRVQGFAVHEFLWKGHRLLVVITGMGKNILRLADARFIQEDSTVVLTGLAKAVNKNLMIGDVLGVESVRKENQGEPLALANKPFPGIPYARLVTCDRLVFHCADNADLADLEGFYAAQRFRNLSIVKAVSDKEENIEFLNEFLIDDKLRKRRLLFRLRVKQWITLIRLLKNARSARKKLADFLMGFLANTLKPSSESLKSGDHVQTGNEE